MPFVAVFGVALNQVLVSIAFGAAAMGLFWVAIRQMAWDLRLGTAMTVLLALEAPWKSDLVTMTADMDA